MVPATVALGVAALVACGSSQSAQEQKPEETGTSAAAITATPAPFLDIQDPLLGSRPVVSVGRDYVLLTENGGVQAFKRNQFDGKGSIDTSANVYPGHDFSDIFSGGITAYNNEVQTISDAFPSVANKVAPVACGSVDAQSQANPLAPGCAYVLYDGDTVYDQYSGHFFAMTKVRRPIWDCQGYTFDVPNTCPGGTGYWNGQRDSASNPIGPCSCAPQDYVDQIDSRSILLAVSKCNSAGTDCEDPGNGWNTYILADEGVGDWAQIVVSRGLVMVNSHQGNISGHIWGFGAEALANGTAPSKPTPAFEFQNSEFKTTNGLGTVMFASMHSPTSSDFPVLVTMDGSNVAAFNVVPTDPSYVAAAAANPKSPALWDLSPWASSLVVSPEATAPVPTWMNQQWDAHPVWSADSNIPGGQGSLYWSFVGGKTATTQGIGAFRWPLFPARPSTGAINPPILSTTPAQGYVPWEATVASAPYGYDFPVLEHNEMSGDTVLMFHTVNGVIPAGPLNESPTYAVAGPADLTFAPAYPITTATGFATSTTPNGNALASAGGAEDILSNVSDPIRRQVFMTSAVTDSTAGGISFTPFLTAVQLPDGPTPPVTGTNPSPLSIPKGRLRRPSSRFRLPGTGVPGAPVTCTAGGDLRSAQQISVGATGVSVTLTAPDVVGSFVEGVSCSNGTSVVIPVTTTAVCAPKLYCANQGVAGGLQCGTVSDGCGNTDNCGTCLAGHICSINMCCPTGDFWNSAQHACVKIGVVKPPVP